MGPVQAQELKSLVESGLYKPDPADVAAAMLRRRGVRELLTVDRLPGGGPGAPDGAAGRSLGAPEFRPRAA